MSYNNLKKVPEWNPKAPICPKCGGPQFTVFKVEDAGIPATGFVCDTCYASYINVPDNTFWLGVMEQSTYFEMIISGKVAIEIETDSNGNTVMHSLSKS